MSGETRSGESTVSRALALAYRELSRRERSVAELRTYLLRRLDGEGGGDVVDGALRELSELGYLDDRRYAQMFVEDKASLSEWGSERIRRELLRRGIERELVEDALEAFAAIEEQPTEGDRAVALLRRRLPEPSSERRERERAVSMLLRRGYASDVAFAAVSEWSRSAPRRGGPGPAATEP